MSSLDAVLAQYEKNQQGGGAQSKMSQDERMKKYFALILGDKEKSGQRRVRILPTPDGSSPFKEAWYHEIQVGGQWQKFYDPGKNDYVLTSDEVTDINVSDIKNSFQPGGGMDNEVYKTSFR